MKIICIGCGKYRNIKRLNETPANYLKRRPYCIKCGHKHRIETLDGHAPNWKGGRIIDKKGYIRIWLARRYGAGYIKEHIHLCQRHFGKIPKGHVVHHKNGLKTDNRIVNLECIPKKEHDRMNTSLLQHHYNRRTHKTECLI